jgi:hypothetical protein
MRAILISLLTSLIAAALIACTGQNNNSAVRDNPAQTSLKSANASSGSPTPTNNPSSSSTEPAEGLETGARYEPLIKTYSYGGGSSVRTGWKLVTRNRVPVVEATLVNEENFRGSRVLVYEVAVRVKLEFDGGKPLSYEIGSKPVTSEDYADVFHRFSTWTVEFQYATPRSEIQGIAEGATARSLQGQILGRAELKRLLQDKQTNEFVGVEIEETHLDDSGAASFVCITQFDYPAGFKRVERVVSGRKTMELFPTWPVSGQ